MSSTQLAPSGAGATQSPLAAGRQRVGRLGERAVIQMGLNDAEAAMIAKAFAAETFLAVGLCKTPPSGLYGFDPTTEYLFWVGYRRLHRLGASDYIAVSRLDGKVRFAGQAGE